MYPPQGPRHVVTAFRYVPYAVTRDPLACTEVSARCVSGDEAECGAESAVHVRPDAVTEWVRQHVQQTGHRRYRRSYGQYIVMEPPEEYEGKAVIGQVASPARPPEDGTA